MPYPLPGAADSASHRPSTIATNPRAEAKKYVSKMGSQKTLNSRQTRIFTAEKNYLDYLQ